MMNKIQYSNIMGSIVGMFAATIGIMFLIASDILWSLNNSKWGLALVIGLVEIIASILVIIFVIKGKYDF